MNLDQLEKHIKDKINAIIQTELSPAVKNEKEYTILLKHAPLISEIKMKAGWSGFNDGDAEYALPVPLFSSYGDDVDEVYKSEYSGEGWDVSWEDDTDNDKYVYDIVASLSGDDFEEFCQAYADLCEKIFGIVGDYYTFDDTIAVKF